MKKLLLALAALIVTIAWMRASGSAAGGPPPFLTPPILMHVAESALDHGHFVFGEEGALPAPIAPELGAATAASASFTSSASILTGSDRDVSNAPDSYEGETGASSSASNGSIIVAGSNHI